MGNTCSCACIKNSSQRAFAAESKRKLAKAIMVVHSVEERVMELGGGAPMKVAELMLEFPGHFAAEYETDIYNAATTTSKRATPLPADHEALPGRTYILFPMHRLHTRVAPHEYLSYKSLLSSYNYALPWSRKKSLHSLLMQASSSKVTPLSSLQLQEISPHLTSSHHQPADADDGGSQIEDEIDSILQQFCSSQINATNNGRLVRSKSWIPKLETINESSVLVV